MTTYTHTTLSNAQLRLADKMSDLNQRFTTAPEHTFALQEACRIWNALTQSNVVRATFPVVAGQAFYTLSTVLEDGTGDLVREQTIRDRALIFEIEYHLIEPLTFTGSGLKQFTIDQIISALQRRRDQFLAETACVVSTQNVFVPGSDNGRVELPDTVIGVRRAVYKTASGRYFVLREASEHTVSAGRGLWTTPDNPNAYTISATPSLTLQITPPPQESGTLELLVVKSGAVLDPAAGSGTLLGVPDDYAWGVKYGALADLLRTESVMDLQRAERCEQLYQLAVELCRTMPVILYAELNGRPVHPASISSTDSHWGGWQGKTRAVSTVLSVVGPDLVGLTPLPNSQVRDVMLDVVANAVVPVNSGDLIQIGRESLDALLGMAQHISTFKQGWERYAETMPLFEQFIEQARKYSMRKSAASTALQALKRYSTREATDNPWEQLPRTVEDEDSEVKSERNARRRPFRTR